MTFPPDFTFPQAKAATAYVAAKVISALTPERRTVVQAGGCVGLWPLALSKYFQTVYTFEPAQTNFECLEANIASQGNIWAFRAALGATRKQVGLTRHKTQAGLWRVDGEGDIQMETLDGVLRDEPIDALVLDVEGSELPAWWGAERLIDTYHPLLWFEYLQNTPAIEAFMRDHGYAPPMCGIGNDYYSIHASRMH